MSVVKSSLAKYQEDKLLPLLGQVRLHLLYKASVHGFTAAAFHGRCDKQGPTVIAAYNAAGFVFGAYTSRDYTQGGEEVNDNMAFLYSIKAGAETLIVKGISGQNNFIDGATGPNFGGLLFLHGDKPALQSNPGTGFNFQGAEMYGDDLNLTELEVYRAEALEALLVNPWRKMQWTAERRQELKQSIIDYKPDIKTVHQARVLMVGPVGAGKSSFFNSINSAFRGNMTSQAIAGTGGTSVTTQFRTYTIKAGKGGETIPLVLCDTMGLEENAGLNTDDLVNIFKGHVIDRYQFSTNAPLAEDAPGYKKQATLNDVIHCVAYVIDTDKVSILSEKIMDKLVLIRKKANQLGIPQIVLLTKVDEACSHVAGDLKNLYRSVYVQQKARQLSGSLGIPLNNMVPVKNYCEDLELELETDILLFMAVEKMLNYADNFFENQVSHDQGRNDVPDIYRSND
ncbi:interferon-induced protein 44-like isoform X3 [Cololabis saira]|uniref:interferon-induced protein 44-like isoform X3 n=1 Tax=Cololabis saira TaxID=129043 RepID=UPI002AD21D5B|nr:interferon-induced protein 44-like isoform X3 [Cololabis saira]